MKVTLESTDKIVALNGIETRIWQGETAAGVPCHCYVALIAVDRAHDVTEFEKELQQKATPRAEFAAIPLRMIL